MCCSRRWRMCMVPERLVLCSRVWVTMERRACAHYALLADKHWPKTRRAVSSTACRALRLLQVVLPQSPHLRRLPALLCRALWVHISRMQREQATVVAKRGTVKRRAVPALPRPAADALWIVLPGTQA